MDEQTRPVLTLLDGLEPPGRVPAGAPPEVLWRAPMPWRDLTGRIAAAGRQVTAVSEGGTVRVLDPSAGWQARFRPGGDVLCDGASCPLDRVVAASPCGIVTWAGDDPDSWSASTRLVLVFAGRPDHAAALVDEEARRWTVPTKHPAGPCGAVLCPFQRTPWEPRTQWEAPPAPRLRRWGRRGLRSVPRW